MRHDERADSSTSSEAPWVIELRAPRASDAAAIWELVEASGVLDLNSPYAYLLLCTHFARTAVVATRNGELIGFVLGYKRPDDGHTAFVWQVGVAERARGRGVGRALLEAWFARCARDPNVHFLEATITPANDASRALFCSFARQHGAGLLERVEFPASLFPAGAGHEEEICLRIGPLPLGRAIDPAQQEAT